MAVRNFWVDVGHSTRKETVGTGPQGRDGRLTAVFYIRDKGGIKKALTVQGWPDGDKLQYRVFDGTGVAIADIATER